MSAQTKLVDAAEEYLALRKVQTARTTYVNDSSVILRFVRGVGDIQVRHLRPEHVERWFFGSAGRPGMAESLRQPSSLNNYRKRLAAFFRFLRARGLLRSDLLANVRVRTVPRRERQRLSAVELLRLIEEATNPRATISRLAQR